MSVDEGTVKIVKELKPKVLKESGSCFDQTRCQSTVRTHDKQTLFFICVEVAFLPGC
jgi:hypothetical protein